MRAVAHSTRTTIRIATILAATAGLLLALTAPFLSAAHADGPAQSHLTFTDGVDSDTVTFTLTHSAGSFSIPGYTSTESDGKFHLSCSDPIDGMGGFAADGNLTFAAGTPVTIIDHYIHRPTGKGGFSTCGEPLPNDDDDQDPDPITTTLTLIKVVEGGEAAFSDFTPTLTFDNENLTFAFGPDAVHVEPGTYTLGEQADEDYDLAGINCGTFGVTDEGEQTLEVTIGEGDAVVCTYTNAFSATDEDDDIIDDEDDDIIDDDEDDNTDNGTEVLDDSFSADDDDTTGGAVDSDTDVKTDVEVLDEAATADELPATGLETAHLALLAALLAAMGVLLLLGTETDKVRAHRA